MKVIGIMRQVWVWRRLVLSLAAREFRARYAGSVFGAIWAILEPLVQFLLYLTVFSWFLGMRLEGKPGVASFALYLMSGLVPYLAFQESLLRAVNLAREQAQLVRHVNVPLEVLLAGSLTAIFARHAVTMVLVLVAAAIGGALAWPGVLWLLFGVMVLVLAAFGLALALVPSGAFLPDLGQFLGTGLTVLFFMTPIVYSAAVLPKGLAPWMVGNPVADILKAFRAGVVGLAIAPVEAAVAVGFALVALLFGGWVFAARSQAVRDVV